MYTGRRMAVKQIIAAGLAALGVTITGATGARGATIVALTHPAKGIVNPHPIAVDVQLGRVFIANYGGKNVSVLDAASGRFLRTIPVSGWPVVAAVDEQTQRLFVGSRGGQGVEGPGSVSVVDAVHGRVLRTVAVGPEPAAIAIDEPANRVFVLNTGDLPTRITGSISMLDATTGRVLRTLMAGSYPVAAVVDEHTGHIFVITLVYHTRQAAFAPEVSMRAAASGRLLRMIALPAAVASYALLASDTWRGRVFVAYASPLALCHGCTEEGSSLSMLDAGTGRILHTVTVRPRRIASVGEVPNALIVDEGAGRVYAASMDATTFAGHLSILDAASDKSLRTVPAGKEPLVVAAAPGAGRLLVVDGMYSNGPTTINGEGALRILDASSGRLLRTLDMDTGLPEAIAVFGRLAFLTDADNVTSVLDVRTGRIVHTVDGVTGQSR